MAVPETIIELKKLVERSERAQPTGYETEVAALREAIDYLTGVAFRSRALNMALDLCQGRHKTDKTDAYAFDSDVIVRQARNFENYLAGKSSEEE